MLLRRNWSSTRMACPGLGCVRSFVDLADGVGCGPFLPLVWLMGCGAGLGGAALRVVPKARRFLARTSHAARYAHSVYRISRRGPWAPPVWNRCT